MSDSIKIILIISIFAFFIYKRKISAFLLSRKEKRLSKKGTEKCVSKETLSACEDTQNVPSVSSEKNFLYRYEVYAFDYAQFTDTGHFADRVSAKLDVIEMSMQNKKHYIKYVELGTLLLILVKYQE